MAEVFSVSETILFVFVVEVGGQRRCRQRIVGAGVLKRLLEEELFERRKFYEVWCRMRRIESSTIESSCRFMEERSEGEECEMRNLYPHDRSDRISESERRTISVIHEYVAA